MIDTIKGNITLDVNNYLPKTISMVIGKKDFTLNNFANNINYRIFGMITQK